MTQHIAAAAEDGALGTLIVGAGPGGLGPLIAARGAGQLDALMAHGLAVVDEGTRAGAGELGRYAIRSDSFADSFLAAPGAAGQPDLSALFEHGAGAMLEQQRGGPVALSTVAEFLAELAAAMRRWLAASHYDPFVMGMRATRARRQADGGWLTECVDGAGAPRALRSQTLVLATGAAQSMAALEGIEVAGRALLPLHADRLMLSGELLGQAGVARLAARLRGIARPRVAVVGGSHSALSAALVCLREWDGAGVDDGLVTVLHRRPFRITYRTPQEALREGYRDFGPEDICPRTGRVYPLAGMRSDSRELLRRCWGLGGAAPEPRLHLRRLEQGLDVAALELLARADLVVPAFGYRPRALALYDHLGRSIALQADRPGQAMVDARSRVLDAGGRPVPGVFGLGLSAGYPLAGVYGEPSFTGQANGLSLWHGDVGGDIVEQVLEQVRRTAPRRSAA